MGGLYLAYDLLGGKRGPLRIVTRAATYTVLFGAGYGIPLGLVYGLVAGLGLGIALGLEFWLAASLRGPLPRPAMLGFAVLRGGTAQGLASALTFDARFGIAFGVLSIAGLGILYMLGFAPSQEYPTERAARPNRRRLARATVARGAVVGLAGTIAGTLTHAGARGVWFGLEIGLVVAAVGAVVGFFVPSVEWWADSLPPQRLGVLGAVLLLAGFALQSVQYWVALLNAGVR
jgi:hypothetical protein